MKKLLKGIIPLVTIVPLLFSCSPKKENVEYIEDKYRNMYEIFVVAFADSDGDGKGDLGGVRAKLDYLKEINYNGIWLTPVHSSNTDHHYDVIDYYDVAEEFGGMSAFDKLVKDAHNKKMTLIMDLVINHSSNSNQWFKDSYAAAKRGDTNDKYYNYYNWVDFSETGYYPQGYGTVGYTDKIAYECRFDRSMPDLNLQQVLDNPNGDLANEIRNIIKFWLIDHDVDGFRLDAITSYFTGDQEKNLAFMTWFMNEVKSVKADAYVVGEGDWSTRSEENKLYQTSGIDSIFQFGNSANNNGYIPSAVSEQSLSPFWNALESNKYTANGGIEAPILGNHDIVRYVGSVDGRYYASNTKFAMGLLSMLNGTPFTYYGDEIGMASQSKTADGFHRFPMLWGDKYQCDINKYEIYGVNKDHIDEELAYPHPSVKKQLADKNSIVNYVKKANYMRLKYPEIARGDFEKIYASENNSFMVIKKTYNDSSIYLAINGSRVNEYTFNYQEYGQTIDYQLTVSGSYKNAQAAGEIVFPPQSILLIK